MIDSHAHLGMTDGEPAEIAAAAVAAGVRRILDVGLAEATNAAALAAASANEGVFAAVGRHPTEAEGFDDDAARQIERLAADDNVRAIGETGLDYYRDVEPAEQRRAFTAQIEIANRTGLPLVIHMRDTDGPGAGEAVAECFSTLAAGAESDVVLHCYSAGPGRVPEAAERGWYVSFAGNVTYPAAAELREAAALVPADRVLVETDSPFLAPQSRRGRPNSPANVVETARVVAEARGVSYGELERAVEANAERVFGW